MGCFPCRADRNKVHPRVEKLSSVGTIFGARPGAVRNNDRTGPESFTLGELANATENFRSECLLTEDGCAYKGTLPNGQVVAVKQFKGDVPECNRKLLVEILMLSLLSHPNIVNLTGYCSDGDQRLAIYEFFPLRSLADRLHDLPPDEEPLSWNTRLRIAAGVAKALEYLHDKAIPQVIFRDLKPSNILLAEGYSPKLHNFQLAKLCPVDDDSHLSTTVMGTFGYCAPEHAMTGQLTVKSDVYSFGVVLLELITGRKAIDPTRPPGERNLVAWAKKCFDDRRNFSKLADSRLDGKFPMHGLHQALAVSFVCVQEEAAARPPISDVVTVMSYLSDPDFACCPSNYKISGDKEDDHRSKDD